MPKGQKHDEQSKQEAITWFKASGGTPEAAAQIAKDYNVSPATVQKWARSLDKKKSPKRKVKRAVKADATWENLFNEYIETRNAAQQALKDSEAAKKKLEAFVKGLK
jgi:DNA-binding MurR/RpiR family transcriptional regulator